MQKMNIWYLSAHDQPKGQSARTYEFSRELVKRGHQVTMFTNSYCHWTHVERLAPREKWRVEEIDGIRVIWLRTIHYTGNNWRRGANMLSNAWRSIQVARALSDKPDVVIGPSVPLWTGWAASKIAGMKGSAFVFEVSGRWMAEWRRRIPPRLRAGHGPPCRRTRASAPAARPFPIADRWCDVRPSGNGG